jgi:hypothetical protein
LTQQHQHFRLPIRASIELPRGEIATPPPLSSNLAAIAAGRPRNGVELLYLNLVSSANPAVVVLLWLLVQPASSFQLKFPQILDGLDTARFIDEATTPLASDDPPSSISGADLEHGTSSF